MSEDSIPSPSRQRGPRHAGRSVHIHSIETLAEYIGRLPPDEVMSLAYKLRSDLPVAAGLLQDGLQRMRQAPQESVKPVQEKDVPSPGPLPSPDNPRRVQELLRQQAEVRAKGGLVR